MASGSGQSIKFEMLVGVDGLIDGLKVATKGVEQSAQAIKLGLGSTGAAARSAAKEHEGFASTLRAFKGEQVAGGRVARYYADQIAAIIPEASGAKGAIGGMIEALSGGIGIGAGIGIAITAFTLLAEETKKAEKQAKALKDAYVDTAASIDKAFRSVADSLAGPLSRTMQAWKGEADKIREHNAKLQKEINEKTAAAANPGFFASVWGTAKMMATGGGGSHSSGPSAEDEEIAALQAQQLAAAKALEDKKVQRDQLTWDELIHHATEAARKFRAIRLQNAVDQDSLNDRVAQTAKRQREEQSNAIDRIADVDKKNREEELTLIGRVADAADELAKKERLAVEDLAGSIASQWSGLVGDMLKGVVSFEDGLKSAFDSILQSFTQMVIQMALKLAILKIFDVFIPGAGSAIGALNAIAGGVAPSFAGAMPAAIGGGGALNINLSSWDGADVMRQVSKPAFQNAIREARRNGLNV